MFCTTRTTLATTALLVQLALGVPASAQEEDATPEPPVRLAIDFVSIGEADELVKAGDLDGALARLVEACEQSDEDATLMATRGVLKVWQDDLEAAHALFLQAISLNTDDPSGYAGLCYLASAAGREIHMQDHCSAARNRNIEDPVYGKITTVAEFMADPDGSFDGVSAETLEGLVNVYPYVPAVRLLSLEANLRANRYDAAAPDLQMLTQMYGRDGRSARLIDTLAAYRVADIAGADLGCLLATATLRILESQGRAIAIDDLQRLAGCRPDDKGITDRIVEHHNTEGMAARTRGDNAAAAEHFKAALVFKPGDPVLLNNLAFAAFEEGDLPTTEDALRQLLELTPDDVQLRKSYGVVLMQLGREEEARPYLE